MRALKTAVPVLIGFVAGILFLVGCPPADDSVSAADEVTSAVCVLHPTEGSDVEGVVRFEKAEGGIQITAEVSGLEPGKHGFHIHQWGDCSAADGTSAGGHFDPEGVDHGGPDSETRHVGDLGNIEAGEDGTATYDRVDTVISFEGDHSIIGRGMIVHAGEDDLSSQPTGEAGGRQACGVIGIAEPAE